MNAIDADERVDSVEVTKEFLVVGLKDGHKISNWKICGGGYGIHWPDLDEDLSTEGLLRGAPAPNHGVSRPPESSGSA